MIAWRFLIEPMQMGRDHIWLVLPLIAAVAVVYKTIRVHRLRELPRQIAALWAYMAIGLAVLTAAFYFIVQYVA